MFRSLIVGEKKEKRADCGGKGKGIGSPEDVGGIGGDEDTC